MDELANPLQAALVSCGSFAVGAGLPLLAAASVTDWQARTLAVAAVSTLGLVGGIACCSTGVGMKVVHRPAS